MPVQKPWQELPAEFTSAVFLLQEVLHKGAEDAFVVLVSLLCPSRWLLLAWLAIASASVAGGGVWAEESSHK